MGRRNHLLITELLLTAALTAARVGVLAAQGQPLRISVWAWVALLAAVLAWASVHVWQQLRLPGSYRRWAVGIWWLAAAGAFVTAPHAMQAERHPILAWLAVLAIGSAFVSQSIHSDGKSDEKRLRALGVALLAIAAIATVQYLAAISPRIGGVDFFYYLCYARDMLQQPDLVPASAYSYFPGVYRFWRTVMQLGGTDLALLQTAHAAVVLSVGVALGWVVYQTTDSPWLSVASPLFYWTWASRFEAFAGITEPLATLFFLLGLIAFGGEPLRGRAGWQRAALCGLAWGMCVFCKQQAGLLTAGYAILVMGKIRYRNHDPWPQLLALPLIATLTLMGGIWFEGRGWEPLRLGLQTATDYQAQGSLWSNLYAQLRHDESAALAAIVSGIALFIVSIQHADRREWPPWLRVLQVAVLGALVSFVQFDRRAYGHYMLLAVPSLVLAYITLASYFWALLQRRSGTDPLVTWICVAIAAFPLFYTGANPTNLHVWRVAPPRLEQLALWHQQPQIQRDLSAAARLMQSAEGRMLVLPRYRNDVYYLANVRAAATLGYGFQLPEPARFPWSELDVIVVVDPRFDSHPERARYDREMHFVLEALEGRGFKQVLALPSLTVYRVHP